MSDDDKKSSSENSVPFVQNDDSSHLVAAAHAQRQRWRRNASLYMNNQPPLPLAALSGKVLYVDFGFTSAREYWTEVAEPAYEPNELRSESEYVRKKLGFDAAEWAEILAAAPRSHADFASDRPLMDAVRRPYRLAKLVSHAVMRRPRPRTVPSAPRSSDS